MFDFIFVTIILIGYFSILMGCFTLVDMWIKKTNWKKEREVVRNISIALIWTVLYSMNLQLSIFIFGGFSLGLITDYFLIWKLYPNKTEEYIWPRIREWRKKHAMQRNI